MAETADVVVIGGGVTGSSTAYALSENPDFTGRIVVLEKDPSYRHAASALSASGVRQQFSSAVNVQLSRYTVAFLEQVELHLATPRDPSGVVFHQHGYLFLGGAEATAAFAANNRLQRSLGVDVHLLDAPALRQRFPWLNTEDVAVGSFMGRGEGWIDGYTLLNAFKRRARANGVEYRHAEVADLLREGDRITGVRCADGSTIAAAVVVNAAGAGGRSIAALAGIVLPIRNIKQSVFAFESPLRVDDMPFTLAQDRLFFRPEGSGYIVGLGIDDALPGEITDYDVDHAVFEDRIWPLLAARVPGFAQLRVRSAWSGHYDMNLFDHNAIVGTVPGREGFYLANGFSGHGVMQSPGIGRALSELIVYGAYRTLDLSDLSFERIAANRPVRENIQY